VDTHVFLADKSVKSLDYGLTAFSALPDAPVLPYKSRRWRAPTLRRRPRQLGATRPVRALRPATSSGPC
jgi:hypothetical protein